MFLVMSADTHALPLPDRDAMLELGMACDGGKDSLSMAAAAGGETVMAPGNLVISAYVTVPDVTKVLTPDLKHPGKAVLLHVDLAAGARRLGGSALAQAYGQLGHESPDVSVAALKGMWEALQGLIGEGKVASGHDISDGGIATTLLEMAFAGELQGCDAAAVVVLPGFVGLQGGAGQPVVASFCLLCQTAVGYEDTHPTGAFLPPLPPLW
jgi:phosphoribosylformylglycinamidine (FGAM) synthase-like enzyme